VPDPISSSTPTPGPNQCLEDDGGLSGGVCPNPATTAFGGDSSAVGGPATEPSACEAPNAVWSLVQQFPAAAFAKASVAGRQPDSTSVVGYDHTGPSPEGDSQRSEVAFVKSSNPSGALQGSSLEVLGVVAQSGAQSNHELIAMRSTLALSHAGFGLAVTADGPSLRASLGVHNDDGSLGGNLGLGGNALGFEATLSTPVGSVTYGDGLSLAASGSIGVRDADHDGKPEYCAKVSLPAYTFGVCLEKFW
jgi:hypothetical protein